jgi:uncharacterized protein (TIGR04255 family)
MTLLKSPTIKFDNPPIVEKVMGIRFEKLSNWGLPHFGLFWQTIKEEFPQFSVLNAIASIEQSLPQPQLLTIDDSVRCWFRSQSQAKIIQVQRDAFLFNWPLPPDCQVYPSHENVLPEFKESWQNFCLFLTKNGLDIPTVKSCEITYINNLKRGNDWENVEDLSSILRQWNVLSKELSDVRPTLASFQLNYLLPDIESNLNISLQPALMVEDSREIFQISITVIGKPASQDVEDMLYWFNAGREYIVRSFVDLTTDEIQKKWGRKG